MPRRASPEKSNSSMSVTPRCPRCRTLNSVDADGRAVCSHCGMRYEIVVDQNAAGPNVSWVPATPVVFLGHRMTTRTYVVGAIVVFFLFVGCWLILHLVAAHQLASQNQPVARVTAPGSTDDDAPDS